MLITKFSGSEFVEEVFVLIDQLRKKHKLPAIRFPTAERITDDTGAFLNLGRVGDDFQ